MLSYRDDPGNECAACHANLIACSKLFPDMYGDCVTPTFMLQRITISFPRKITPICLSLRQFRAILTCEGEIAKDCNFASVVQSVLEFTDPVAPEHFEEEKGGGMI